MLAFTVIVALYVSIGVMAAFGSVYLSQRYLPVRFEPVVFGLFLASIAAFYLAFVAYFGDDGAWHTELLAVAAFTAAGLLGIVVRPVLVLGYVAHGAWDLVHELQGHGGIAGLGEHELTHIPLAYGVFCGTYDLFMATYLWLRRKAVR